MQFFKNLLTPDLPDPYRQSRERFEKLQQQQFRRGLFGASLIILLVAWASLHGWQERARAEQAFAVQAAKLESGARQPTQPGTSAPIVREGMPTIHNQAPRPDNAFVSDERKAEIRAEALEASLEFSHRQCEGGVYRYQSKNRYHQFEIAINSDGVALSALDESPSAFRQSPQAPPERWEVQLQFSSLGRGNFITPMESPIAIEPSSSDAKRVELSYPGGISEWYVNERSGLEQGFTVTRRPAGHGPLVAEISLMTSLEIHQRPGRPGIEFRTKSGRTKVCYDNLHVFGADGSELNASMKLSPSSDAILLTVDDADAVYPLTIDPVMANQEEEILASDAAPGDEFGSAGAGKDDVMILGAQGNGSGAAYVFIRDEGGPDNWGEKKVLRMPNSESPQNGDLFGASIAVWCQEETGAMYAAIGAPAHGGCGAVAIFERNLGGKDNWGFVDKLVGSAISTGAQFGHSVSGLGSRLAVGAPMDAGMGSAFVFEFADKGGNEKRFRERQRLTAQDGQTGDLFGLVVVIGLLLLAIGAPGRLSSQGAVYMFRAATITALFVFLTILLHQNPLAGALFGSAIAMILGTIAIGAYKYNVNNGQRILLEAGSVSVFEFQPQLLTFLAIALLLGNESGGFFGYRLVLSFFLTLVVTAPLATSRAGIVAGAVFVYIFDAFRRAFFPGDKVVPSTFIDPGFFFGSAIILLGAVLFVAGLLYNGSQGALFRFTLVGIALSFLSWLLLFFTPQQLADPTNVGRVGLGDDYNGDGIPNVVAYTMAWNPFSFTGGPSLLYDKGKLTYLFSSSLVSLGFVLFLQYALSLGIWFGLPVGPFAGMMQTNIVERGIERNLLSIVIPVALAAFILLRLRAEASEANL